MIKYQPDKILKKIAPPRKIERLLKGDFSVKKTALSFVDDIDFIDKSKVIDTALKVVDSYQNRIAKEGLDSGKSASKELASEIKDDPKLLIQRVQNEVVFQMKEAIADKYSGEFYVWTPSSAETPDPEHQLNYGKTFQIGSGEMPGDRYGCQCGMEILVKETQLNL